jgi:hypothetical protein
MGVFQAFGVPGPESFFGFGVSGIESAFAILRAEIMGALFVAGRKTDTARVESLAANRVYRGFRHGIDICHGLTSLRWLFDATVIDG